MKFCFFSHATGYSAIDATDVAKTLKRISGVHAAAPGRTAAGTTNKRSIEARLKEKATKVLNRLPPKLSGRIYQFFQLRRTSIVEAVIGVRHLISAARAFSNRPSAAMYSILRHAKCTVAAIPLPKVTATYRWGWTGTIKTLCISMS
ncbi:hypothetical protein LJU32_23830 [Pseudomonas sp. B21_DOA]|nr:hypothetical protein LJU32_23830 [Pseudomonas sp. B21_DOA]